MHQAGPIRENGKEVLTVPYNLLQLAARGFANCFRKGCEGKALCLCCLLECLQSTGQCMVSATAARIDVTACNSQNSDWSMLWQHTLTAAMNTGCSATISCIVSIAHGNFDNCHVQSVHQQSLHVSLCSTVCACTRRAKGLLWELPVWLLELQKQEWRQH